MCLFPRVAYVYGCVCHTWAMRRCCSLSFMVLVCMFHGSFFPHAVCLLGLSLYIYCRLAAFSLYVYVILCCSFLSTLLSMCQFSWYVFVYSVILLCFSHASQVHRSLFLLVHFLCDVMYVAYYLSICVCLLCMCVCDFFL